MYRIGGSIGLPIFDGSSDLVGFIKEDTSVVVPVLHQHLPKPIFIQWLDHPDYPKLLHREIENIKNAFVKAKFEQDLCLYFIGKDNSSHAMEQAFSFWAQKKAFIEVY